MSQSEPQSELELALDLAVRSEAYQAGVVVGRSGSLGLNPYPVDSMDHEYWKLGHCFGAINP